MYSYDDIFLFVQLSEIGNFTHTAKKIGISQSTLSRRIKELEQSLNAVLIRRNTKSFELTEIGNVVYKYFQGKNTDFDLKIDELLANKKTPSGVLTVSIPFSISIGLITPHIPDFLFKYPQIKLNICYQNKDVNLIKDGLDMAIMTNIPSQQTQKIKTVFTSEHCLYCTEEYKAQFGIPNNFSDLKNHLVTGQIFDDYSVPKNMEILHKPTGKLFIVEMPDRITVNNVDQAKVLLMTNKVIGGIPSFMANSIAEKLIRVLPEYRAGITKFYMIRHNNENDMKCVVFCEFVENLLKEAQEKYSNW